MHKVNSYDILGFCIKYTLFLHVLVPDKTSFLDHPLKIALSDMPTLNRIGRINGKVKVLSVDFTFLL